MVSISSSEFIKSSSSVLDCPNTSIPEFAFIGRSNVGKSSLINVICDRKNLAITSKIPGKTKFINHFLIDSRWHLVDLPGYGYASVSKKTKNEFKKIIYAFFLKRLQLVNTFLLIDIRHSPQQNDIDFMNWLGINHIPFSIVFTKAYNISFVQSKKLVNKKFKVKVFSCKTVRDLNNVALSSRNNLLQKCDLKKKVPGGYFLPQKKHTI